MTVRARAGRLHEDSDCEDEAMPTNGDGEQTAERPSEKRSAWMMADAALEMRLSDDEARLAADEARLAADEARLAAEEERARINRRVAMIGAGLALVLAVAVAALVIGVSALRRDVDAIAAAAPENSVATESIRDSAVTAEKLAAGSVASAALRRGAVHGDAIAAGAVGQSHLASGAVTAGAVRPDSLTGATIREATLQTVPSARQSRRTRTADEATRLGGAPATAYLARVKTVRATTRTDGLSTKGPLTARCPVGTRIVSGGAAVDGVVRGVAIIRSSPAGHREWVAAADRYRRSTAPWRLVVTAICAAGGDG
jgi:hypothetical protein